MASSLDIDSAIDRLDEALRTAGLAGVDPANDVAAVAELADAVAPYVLPAELRRFWERIDAERVPVYTFPMVRGPATALDLLSGLRELGAVPSVPPPLLLPIDYASHCYGTIELGSKWNEGGTMLEWGFDDLPLVSSSLADRIDVLAELLVEGSFERGDGFLPLDHRAEQEKRRERLTSSGPDPVYGEEHAIPSELESWPAHWLAASGIDLRDRIARGATHTIAELVAAAETGPVTGRIHANVVRLVGIGSDVLVLVEDDTGRLDVWCPAGTSPWGPVHRRSFELELTLERAPEPPPDLDTPHAEIVRHALAGDLEGAQAAASSFSARLTRTRPSAVATDVRPLD